MILDVKGNGLIISQRRSPHEIIYPTDLGSISDMIKASLPGAKIDKTNFTSVTINIASKFTFDAMFG